MRSSNRFSRGRLPVRRRRVMKRWKNIGEKEYRKAFGLPDRAMQSPEVPINGEGPPVTKAQQALEHALDIRKFEIEMYWKRATYFWAFIAAALAGYGVVQNSEYAASERATQLSVLIGALGFVFSFAWFCANRGSKHWQENWENHVDLLEDGVMGPLYKTVLQRAAIQKHWYTLGGAWDRLARFLSGPRKLSVSKINQVTSLFVVGLWVPMVFRVLPPFHLSARIDWFLVSVIAWAGFASLLISFSATDEKHYRLEALRRSSSIEDGN